MPVVRFALLGKVHVLETHFALTALDELFLAGNGLLVVALLDLQPLQVRSSGRKERGAFTREEWFTRKERKRCVHQKGKKVHGIKHARFHHSIPVKSRPYDT